MKDKDRDTLLIELKTDMKWVVKGLTNHLSSHSRMNIMAWSTTAGALIALILMLIKSLGK